MTVLDVEEAQLPRIAELERQCFSVPWTVDALRRQIAPDHVFLAAVENGTVLGYAGMLHVLDEGYISNVAVDPEYRRRGIGGALLEELERRGRALGLAFLTLEVRCGNAPAIALYEGRGYRRAGLRKKYYTAPAEDALLMTLELDET